ncbi:MAG: hypothetical protein WDM89_18125 [Rhizomicrobium sp.]
MSCTGAGDVDTCATGGTVTGGGICTAMRALFEAGAGGAIMLP